MHESSLDHTLVFHIHSSRESLYFQSILDSLQRELWHFSLPVMSYSIIRYRSFLKDSKMRQVWSMVLILFLEGSEWGAGKWERGEFLFYSNGVFVFFFFYQDTKYQSPNWQAMPKVTKVEKGWLNLPENLTMSSQSDGFTILNEIFSNHKSYNAFQNNEKREKGK